MYIQNHTYMAKNSQFFKLHIHLSSFYQQELFAYFYHYRVELEVLKTKILRSWLLMLVKFSTPPYPLSFILSCLHPTSDRQREFLEGFIGIHILPGAISYIS